VVVSLRARKQLEQVEGPKKPRGELEDKREFLSTWLTSTEAVSAKRTKWLHFDRDTNRMYCDACIRFNTSHPSLSFITGCNSIRLERIREHERAAEINGHGDALYKLLNCDNFAADFQASLSQQISIESDGLLTIIKIAYWLAKEMVPNIKLSSLANQIEALGVKISKPYRSQYVMTSIIH